MEKTELNLSVKKRVSEISFGDKIQVIRFKNHEETEILQDCNLPFVKHFEAIILDEVLAIKYDKESCDIVLKTTGRYYLPLLDGSQAGVVYSG